MKKIIIKNDADPRSPLKLSTELLAGARTNPNAAADSWKDIFTPAEPRKGVLPEGRKAIAMDETPSFFSGDSGAIAPQLWAGNAIFNEGMAFMGYNYLSLLAQIPEFRLISEVISTEATRKWIKIQSSTEDASKGDRVKELEDEFKRLRVREMFQTVSELDGWFGRSHIFIDTGDVDDRDELKTNLGDGTTDLTKKKLKQGSLRTLRYIEPVWSYPTNYNANDPLKAGWYDPETWFVMGKEVHRSRFLTFISMPVPDLLKPAFSFGGLSRTQIALPYVRNWLQTRQSVNALIQAFSTMVLKTDMQVVMAGSQAPGSGLLDRVDLFNNLRNNRATMVLNKDTEDFQNVSAPLSGLDHLQAQAQEHMASISRIPLIKLLGITPSGLNASSDGEIRSFYDTIHAYQEKFFSPHLHTIFRLAQINLWGEVDPELSFVYEPLWEMDEKSIAEMRNTEANTDALYIDKSVLAPEEVRARISKEPESPYGPIDPDILPEADEPLQENITESETITDGDEDETDEDIQPLPEEQNEEETA